MVICLVLISLAGHFLKVLHALLALHGLYYLDATRHLVDELFLLSLGMPFARLLLHLVLHQR